MSAQFSLTVKAAIDNDALFDLIEDFNSQSLQQKSDIFGTAVVSSVAFFRSFSSQYDTAVCDAVRRNLVDVTPAQMRSSSWKVWLAKLKVVRTFKMVTACFNEMMNDSEALNSMDKHESKVLMAIHEAFDVDVIVDKEQFESAKKSWAFAKRKDFMLGVVHHIFEMANQGTSASNVLDLFLQVMANASTGYRRFTDRLQPQISALRIENQAGDDDDDDDTDVADITSEDELPPGVERLG